MLESLPAFEAFLEKSYTHHTVRSYGREVRRLAKFFDMREGVSSWDQVSAGDIEAYLRQKGTSNANYNRALAALRCWYRFLDPAQKPGLQPPFIVERKLDASVRQVSLSLDEIREVAKASLRPGRTGARNQLLVKFLYGSGLRLSELLQLQQCDLWISLDDPRVGDSITIRTRPPALARLYLSEVAKESLNSWLALAYRESLLTKDGPELHVWVSTQTRSAQLGVPVMPQALRDTLRRIGSKTSFTETLSPRLLRKTFEAHLKQVGVPHDTILHLLGRRPLKATTPSAESIETRLEAGIVKFPHPWR